MNHKVMVGFGAMLVLALVWATVSSAVPLAASPSATNGYENAAGYSNNTFDIDGRRRIDPISHQVDMGAYEFLPQMTFFVTR